MSWTPASTTTALWLDASDSSTLFDATLGGSLPAANAAVRRWQDKSGNNRHLTEASAAPLRRTALQNGLDGLEFNNSVLTAGTMSIPQPFSVFLVMELRSTAPAESDAFGSATPLVAMRANWAGSNTKLYFAGASPSLAPALPVGDHIWGWVVNGASSSQRLNGTATAIGTTVGASSLGNVILGRQVNGGQYLPANYFEVIVVPSVLTADLEKIEGYAAHKWGFASLLPIGHPYKDSPPPEESGPAAAVSRIGPGGLVY